MKTRMAIKHAQPIMDHLIERLSPGCERIEVAGSIRRGCKVIGDFEIVAIPKLESTGLFGHEAVSALDPILESMTGDLFKPVKNGPKYKQFLILTTKPSMSLDLFLTNADSWGYQMAIRTGPWQYSRALVTQRCKGGLLDDDHLCHDGIVWKSAGPRGFGQYAGAEANAKTDDENTQMIGDMLYRMVKVPEESDFFDLIDGGFVEPSRRQHQ